jgi:chemotaxis protein MotA
MFVIIGAVIVLACVFGAYSVHGNLLILIQPVEFVIILGAALGAFIIGNTKTNIKQTLKGLKRALKGPTYKKADYIELLSVLYQLFKLAKTKGMLALEQHVEKPDESALFGQFPKFQQDHHAVGDLEKAALGPAHALGDLDEVEMIDAACRGGHSDEHAPG